MTEASTESSNVAAPTLIVHHLNNSRSHRIVWLLEELEVPYTMKEYKRDKGAPRAPPELKKIHPLGKAPAITDGDINLAESGAIVEYIIKKYGKGKADPPPSGELDDLYFSHYAEGSLMIHFAYLMILALVMKHTPFIFKPLLWPAFTILKRLVTSPELKRHLAFVESHLAKGGDWFAGGDHPTGADYMMAYSLEGIDEWDPSLLGPKSKAYVARVHDRPAYKRAVAKGGQLQLTSL